MSSRDESARSSRGNEAGKSPDGLLTSAATKDDDREPPGVPIFRTWRGVYLFVFVVFVLVVVALVLFSRAYG